VFVESIVGHALYCNTCKNVLSSQTILISESEERFQTTETDSRLLAGTEKDLFPQWGKNPDVVVFRKITTALEVQ